MRLNGNSRQEAGLVGRPSSTSMRQRPWSARNQQRSRGLKAVMASPRRAEEGGEGRAAGEELDELAAGDVEADAVALAARAAGVAVVVKPPIRPREIHVLTQRRVCA